MVLPLQCYAWFTGGYEINLDKRKLKTPLGKLFKVPTEVLALAVLTEWHGQTDTIKRHTMHMVSGICWILSYYVAQIPGEGNSDIR